jgi:hypothetical protein
MNLAGFPHLIIPWIQHIKSESSDQLRLIIASHPFRPITKFLNHVLFDCKPTSQEGIRFCD